MQLKNIADVQPGDTFTFNGETTTVKKVDSKICKNKVHINDKDCYESFMNVYVR